MRKCKIKFTENEEEKNVRIDFSQGDFSKLELLGLIDLFKASLTRDLEPNQPYQSERL